MRLSARIIRSCLAVGKEKLGSKGIFDDNFATLEVHRR